MKLATILILFSLAAACGGTAFTSEALSLSPGSSDSGAFDDAQGPPASDGDGRRGEAGPVAPDSLGPGDPGGSEAATRDVRKDPWPDDVVVEPVSDGQIAAAIDAASEKLTCEWAGTPATGCPCINCNLFTRPDGTTDHYACCDASGNHGDAATDHLCNQGDFPSPHRAYCAGCACN